MRTFVVVVGLLLTGSAFAQNTTVINVNAAADRHAIDPRIYGAAWASGTEISTHGLTLNRWGGNAMSRYNWAFSTANRCKDYFFFNIPDNVSSGDGSNGKSADDFISLTRNAGADAVMTIPMLSLLPEARSKQCSFPAANYPGQEAYSNPDWEPIVCGNGRMDDGNPNTEGPRILGVPDPNNISTSYPLSHQGDWVQHMIDTFGSAAAGGMKYYSLDNEPGLWSFDHWDVHPTGTSYDEVWGKMSELGAIIRAKDPAAVITGGEEWGWSGYFLSGLDVENNNTADKTAHGGVPYYDWLLQQFAAYEVANNVRILDVWTAHYYPQSGEFWSGSTTTEMQELRNRSTRSLWDPNYVDESWIGGTEIGGAKVRLIPRLKDWVNNNYPGTQIGITEYNWGDVDHINAATAQADILGIFGREDLDMAVRWTSPGVATFAGNAFRMYRNYDGAGSKFGDVSVSASGPNPDEVSAFAAQRTSDGALTIMIIEKTVAPVVQPPVTRSITVNLSGFTAGQAIQRWELTSANAITRIQPDLAPGVASIALSVPLQSVTLLIVPPAAAPTLTATATGASQVSLSWTAVGGAASYEIERSFNDSAFTPLITVAGTSHTDNGLTANTTYLYRVRTVAGAFSNIDSATTTVFTDPLLAVGGVVKAAHFTELRTAVNAMRASAGLAPQVFTDSTLTTIKAVHLTELRTALNAARAEIGLAALTYTNPSPSGVTVKAVHVNGLRAGVQ